jgi:SAM-dependent methyltransferase
LRPRLPIAGTHFVDLSPAVAERLEAHGGLAIRAGADSLPFAEETFDLVCACDVIEHVADDRRVFQEVSRVLKDNGTLMLSTPLHSHLWTEFDDWVGHARRYDLGELVGLLAGNGLTVQQSAIFGMKPQSPRLIRFAMRWLERHPREAMFWYNWLAMPLSLRLQRKLKLEKGILEPTGVDEMLLICRRRARVASAQPKE